MTRYRVIGLEKGAKRILEWFEGELIGDADLKDRFQKMWDAVDHRKYCKKLPEHLRESWTYYLVEELLGKVVEETLDLERAHISTEQRLQEWADAWNSHGGDRHYTIDDMRKMEEDQNWSNHHGPPYEWREIEAVLSGKIKAFGNAGQPPDDYPKCLECLAPMEWIYFSSSPETWAGECGRAGWTAICKKCKTWRPCRISVMN
ncbi:hypothetical protein [Prosthecobacter sp.]|uniref:hypothetical protein n=1 Tax=Prosthecobacter sp. TaxID=1965333 RepID=UPI003782EF7A